MSWFDAKTKHRGEFKALNFFNSIGVNSYVPSYQTKRIWSDRIKKVTVPAINGYIFFELQKLDFNLINVNPFTKNIVKKANGSPAIIKENEIAIMKRHLSGETLKYKKSLFDGQNIKICSGPFMFKKGTINKVGENKVIINLESLNISLVLNKTSVVAA